MRLRRQVKIAVKVKIARLFFQLMPSIVSKIAGKLGFSRYIKNDPNIVFIGKVYKGKFNLLVHGDRNVEKDAASNIIATDNAVRAISKVNLDNAFAIDIGANVGTVSMFMIEQGASKVYAFEPGPLFRDLQNNLDMNDLQEKVTPINLGLSDSETTMYWAEDQNNKGNAHLLQNFNELDLSKHRTNFGNESLLKKVQVSTLDNYFSNVQDLKRLDFIKIDVEGLEWKVIKGGKNLIKKFKPAIIAETHRGVSDMFGYDCVTPIFEFLYSLDYESFSLDDDGNIEKFLYPNFKMDTLFLPKSI